MTTSNDELMRAIGRLEGKVDALIANETASLDRMNRIDIQHGALEKKVEQYHQLHSSRINSLDRKQYAIIAIATVLWSVFGLLAKYFLN